MIDHREEAGTFGVLVFNSESNQRDYGLTAPSVKRWISGGVTGHGNLP